MDFTAVEGEEILLDEVDDVGDDTSDDGGDTICGFWLLDLVGVDRNAFIFSDEEAARSYSSMRFARSSSDLMEIRASRSSVGSWHLKLTSVPHRSSNLDNSLGKEMERLTARTLVWPPK